MHLYFPSDGTNRTPSRCSVVYLPAGSPPSPLNSLLDREANAEDEARCYVSALAPKATKELAGRAPPVPPYLLDTMDRHWSADQPP